MYNKRSKNNITENGNHVFSETDGKIVFSIKLKKKTYIFHDSLIFHQTVSYRIYKQRTCIIRVFEKLYAKHKMQKRFGLKTFSLCNFWSY